MKIIEKLKKWIAGFTAASLVLAMMPVLPAQAALLDAPKRPVASVLGGYYSGPKTVSLTTDAKACTYYVKNTVSGIFAPGKFDLNDFLSSREASQYNAEEGITIDADHAQSVVLRGLSFFPKTEEDCTLKLSNIKRWTLPSFMEPQVYVFDKVAPNVLINGEAPKAVYGSKDLHCYG
jgi:hypothetical protein